MVNKPRDSGPSNSSNSYNFKLNNSELITLRTGSSKPKKQPPPQKIDLVKPSEQSSANSKESTNEIVIARVQDGSLSDLPPSPSNSNSDGDPLEREMNLTEVEQRVQAAVDRYHRVSQAFATDGFSVDIENSQRALSR